MPDEQGVAANRLEDSCYDSNLPTGCYFIVGRPLSTPFQKFANVPKHRLPTALIGDATVFLKPRTLL
jgi:hypothetical protein